MSADGDVSSPHEVVIVRRRGGDGEEGHHGGAWKIAFADLMTAMMAFFLVMWLLNVSDKEKIQQIATYFNPLKLNSKRPTTKGVEEEQETEKTAPTTVGPSDKGANISDIEGKDKMQGASKPGGDGELKEGVAQKAEEELFNDPYGVLARLALKAASDNDQIKDAKSESTLPGGDAYSNPFEPFAERPIVPDKNTGQAEPSPMTLDEAGDYPKPPGLEPPLEVKPEEAGEPAPKAVPAEAQPADAAKDADAEKSKAEARALEGEILKELQGLAPEKKPSIEVKKVDEGYLISLTDDFRFGMFASASAEPRPELVLVMEKVAKVLAARDGNIVVRGHTDAKKFRSEKNNNWRLSMSRAQMAYYMLVRGGVQETRFESIEGQADRKPKIPSDPNAAENRRIEILLRVPRT
ncbi:MULTISPECIES: MotB family protein [Hyphomicrobium]|jgi:chemotaxis protein MotB|uniref:MotB family protein n=1 Tax=Hyphomicrobium TaxID=81 RepID=UPI00037FD856|nr:MULTISPECIES: MotB family protein [Hyphomicrobium]WBT39270.1 MotB family protein [Hyphomicrobium sp. DMF-1]HML41980.1 MotB family protein [Hyphomicrobium zavarzinii]